MKKQLDLYFAHSFDRRHEFRKLELELEKNYNLNLLNPFFDIMSRKDRQLILSKSSRTEAVLGYKRSQKDCNELVYQDLHNIDNRDGLFTIIHEPSLGTAFEISHAYKTGKLVFVISEKFCEHSWIRVYADYRFRTVDEFMAWLDSNGYKRTEKKKAKFI